MVRLVAYCGAWLVVSAVTAAAQDRIWQWDGQLPNDQFGTAVSDAGDVDGDGFDDVAVGAPVADNNGVESGTVYIMSGQTGVILRAFDGDAASDRLGSSVCMSSGGYRRGFSIRRWPRFTWLPSPAG